MDTDMPEIFNLSEGRITQMHWLLNMCLIYTLLLTVIIVNAIVKAYSLVIAVLKSYSDYLIW